MEISHRLEAVGSNCEGFQALPVSRCQHQGFDLFHSLEVAVLREQGPTDLHAAGCNPDIVDGDETHKSLAL